MHQSTAGKVSPGKLEQEYVHHVYDVIAPHFSSTRYKPWPLVEKYLLGLNLGALVADVGCGNGKYMNVNKNAFFIGSDRSSSLISICKSRDFECMVCDGQKLPFRDEAFDAVISIAVIHHFSTHERRLRAIEELLRIVRKGGSLLITVWALEQEKKKFTEQDVFIPWHLQPQFKDATQTTTNKVAERESRTEPTNAVPVKTSEGEYTLYHRYYHLFKKGEVDELILQIKGTKILESVWDKDNWYVIVGKE